MIIAVPAVILGMTTSMAGRAQENEVKIISCKIIHSTFAHSFALSANGRLNSIRIYFDFPTNKALIINGKDYTETVSIMASAEAISWKLGLGMMSLDRRTLGVTATTDE